MTISVKGDFSELERFIDRLNAPDEFLEHVAESLPETTLNLISDGFRAGSDPYGDPWNAPNDLQITGRLRSYTKVRSSKSGFTVASTDQKAIWHHDPQPRPRWGGKALPTRLQVPVASRGLPQDWSDAFQNAVLDEWEAWLNG